MSKPIFIIVKNQSETLNVYCPMVYGLETWGQSSQIGIDKEDDGHWYHSYWCEEDKLNVIFESENTDDIYKFVKEYYPNQLEEIDQQIKEDLETFESLREWLHE